ncbi:helix-turn-helix domain-containing protein [Streptomyces sp. NPDC059247]|uniref:helix-turn-helix domain-containing protein n=1 Tax=Streptomyces sp. NPDC059247 TaxID=3346790 RepID=UPI00369B4D2E
MAEDAVIVADMLIGRSHDEAILDTDLLNTAIAMRTLSEQMIAALVVHRRSEGKPLDDFAHDLHLTVDRLRKKYPPERTEQELAARRRPQRINRRGTTEPPDTRLRLRHPRQRLACAMTLTFRASEVRSQRELAEHMGIDASYVSRLLSGHRDASWQHVKRISEVCQGDQELLQSLWDAAASGQPRITTSPCQDLRTYLRALLYAAGSPDEKTVLRSTQGTLTADELRQALEGPRIPSWVAVKQLTLALQSLPQITLPMWRRAQSDPTASGYPAGSFG